MRIGLFVSIALVASACASGATDASGAEPASTSTTGLTTSTSSSIPTTTSLSTTTTSTSTSTTTTMTLPPGTLEEDARAVILAGLPGTVLDASTESFLNQGGRAVILFTKNLDTPEQVAALTRAVACAATGPVITAVDQEPGRVARLTRIGISSPDPALPVAEFRAAAAVMADAMIGVGINLDLAPVVDVARGTNPVLVGRNFGSDAAVVADKGKAFIEALAGSGVGSTAKHFPGHGLSTVDPHVVVTPIDADLKTLQTVDFPPFRTAIASGAGAVMIGHPIYAALDPENPASLSPAVLTLLRTDFGFDGVAMTDAFSMAGVREGRTLGQVTVEALAAGQDMLIVDNPTEVTAVVEAIVAAVSDGSLDRERLGQAAGRVRRLAGSLASVEC